MSILSGVVRDPHGYGRVVRDAEGEVVGIVEQKDATPEQAAVAEINSGILAFDAEFLDRRCRAWATPTPTASTT